MKFTHPDFKRFIFCLHNNTVEYMLVGGYAVILHGYVRGTGDMDVWVNPTEDNRIKLINALKEFGYKEEDLTAVKSGDPILTMRGSIDFGVFSIDILTIVDKIKFDEAAAKAVIFKIEDTEVKVIEYHHLIQTKIASDRTKDKADVEELGKIKRNEK